MSNPGLVEDWERPGLGRGNVVVDDDADAEDSAIVQSISCRVERKTGMRDVVSAKSHPLQVFSTRTLHDLLLALASRSKDVQKSSARHG